MYSLIVVDYCSIEQSIEYVEHIWSVLSEKDNIKFIIVDNSPYIQEEIIISRGYIRSDVKVIYNKKCYFYYKNDINICYCYSEENLGFAKGNNFGTIISDELFGSEYYIVSNNDLKIDGELNLSLFESLFKYNPEIAVIGPKIVGKNGTIQSPHKRVSAFKRLIAYYWLCRWPFYINIDYDYTGNSKECYRVMGCFMIISAQAFKAAGRFDSNTFLFFEESILSERLQRIGFKTYFYNDLTVVHEHSATIKKMNSLIKSEKLVFESGCYYYKMYRNTPKILIEFAKVNFNFYLLSLKIKLVLKKYLI